MKRFAIILICLVALPIAADPVQDGVKSILGQYPAIGAGECVSDMWYAHQNPERLAVLVGGEALILFDANGNIISVSQRVKDFVARQQVSDLRIEHEPGYRYYDGCNTHTYLGGGVCSSTAVYCGPFPVALIGGENSVVLPAQRGAWMRTIGDLRMTSPHSHANLTLEDYKP